MLILTTSYHLTASDKMLVSVYIPTKNRLTSLKKAVKSVLEQDYKDIEIIIVNDASTDSTESWLNEISIYHKHIKVIHHLTSMGAPTSRNEAIKLATGHFITGLDDDDYFLPGRISGFVEYWNTLSTLNESFSCLYSQDRFDDGGVNISDTKKRSSICYEDLFESNWIGNQIFTTRSKIIEAGLFNEKLPAWQDLETFMRVVHRFGQAKLLDATTYYFDNTPREDRISRKSKKRLYSAYKIISNEHCKRNPLLGQKLYLQIFSPFYGFKPNISDWIYFLSLGPRIKGAIQLANKYFQYR